MHLREAIELCSRTGDNVVLPYCLDACGHLCAATARWAGAITMWAAYAAALATATVAMLLWTGPGPGVPGPRWQRTVRAARRDEVPIPDDINRRAV